MTHQEWWQETNAEGNAAGADRTFGEEVWNASKKDAWATVFQIVSDNPQMATRDFIKQLEAARDADKAGPTT